MEESERRVLCDWCEEPIYRSEEVHVIAVRDQEYLVHSGCGQIAVVAHVQQGGDLRVADRERSLAVC